MKTLEFLKTQVRPIAYKNAFLIPQVDMTLDVERDGKMFVISYAPFGIDVYSSTFKGVTKEFNEYVSELWEIYAEAEDEILSDDARNLKRRLRNTFVLRKQDDFRESSSTIPFYYHPEAMNRTFSYANS